MKMDTLDALGDGDLRAVIARAEELLAQHDRERKATALEQARAILAGAGLSLRDVAAKPKNGTKGPVYHGGQTYQHPSNKALVWKAKGQKPGWLRDLEASGGKAVEVANA
jgi:H-NS histone family